METAIMMTVLGFLVFAVIAMGGAVVFTVKNRRAARKVYAEYDEAMRLYDQKETVPRQAAPVSRDLFFTKEEKTGRTVKFYASAPSIGVDIPVDEPIDCDYDEICSFVDRIYDNTEDNFFVLEDDRGSCIQFFHDGISERVELDIPVAGQKGSYKGEFTDIRDVKSCIRSFLSGMDVSFNYPVKFEDW